MAWVALGGVREATYMDKEVWLEEYHGLLAMGLSQQEIARAFRCTEEALQHRLKRSAFT